MRFLGSFFLFGLLSVSMIFGHAPLSFASEASRAKISSQSVLALQAPKISPLLHLIYKEYFSAKMAYQTKGPQAFVGSFGKSSGLSESEQKSFLTMFRGLPELPNMVLSSRGFALIDRRVGYRVEVEVVDYDQSIFKINRNLVSASSQESFESGSTKIYEAIKAQKISKGMLHKLQHWLIPEAKATVLVPLLVGGLAFAIVKMFTRKKEQQTSASQRDGMAREPASISPGSVHGGAGDESGDGGGDGGGGGKDEVESAQSKKNSENKSANELENICNDQGLIQNINKFFQSVESSNNIVNLSDPQTYSGLTGSKSNEWELKPTDKNLKDIKIIVAEDSTFKVQKGNLTQVCKATIEMSKK